MTYFLNFRTARRGGAVSEGTLIQVDDTTQPEVFRILPKSQIASICSGKDVLLAAHGFNVDYYDAVPALGLLDQHLNLPASTPFIGILWPGDFYGLGLDYPFEGEAARETGRNLAAICNIDGQNARTLSFFSHSLGARVLLEAISHLRRDKISLACITAGAVNRFCLSEEYAKSAARCQQISLLASPEDWVLKYLFPAGDIVADLLHHDHAFLEAALGYRGPPDHAADNIKHPWMIAEQEDFGHGDYVPSPDSDQERLDKAIRMAGFVRRALHGAPQTWPTGWP